MLRCAIRRLTCPSNFETVAPVLTNTTCPKDLLRYSHPQRAVYGASISNPEPIKWAYLNTIIASVVSDWSRLSGVLPRQTYLRRFLAMILHLANKRHCTSIVYIPITRKF